MHLSSYTETRLFDSIDSDTKGWIGLADLEYFCTSRDRATNYTRFERAYRRMDQNRDGRISFEEFLLMIRPTYSYSSTSYDIKVLASSPYKYGSPAKYYSPLKSNLDLRAELIRSSPMRSTLELRAELMNRDLDEKISEIKEEKSRLTIAKNEDPIFSTPVRDSTMRSKVLRKSLYADQYLSPARRLAQEVRTEILSRSMDRARYRALSPYRHSHRHWSPTRTRHLNSTLLAAELDSSRRYYGGRHSSPMRHTRYYSPHRETLELSRLRETRERARLRESLAFERTSLARDSIRRELELKTTSMVFSEDKKQLSPRNRANLVVNLKDQMYDNKMLEEKRIDLSLRYDFCLNEFFSMFDYSKTGYLSLSDFERFSYDYNILLNRADLCIIIDRFDNDRDGLLSFSEFCDIFLPKQSEFRRSMQERLDRRVDTFFGYTGLTQQYTKDLLKLVVDVQENFEVTKFRMSDGRVLNSDEIFAFLDKWKTGYITLTEFELALKEAGVIASDKDVKALFDQFDKNHDGRITFDEFHSPVRSRYYY
jgi:Ca2+-binding EF-hand superfamily protein